MSNDTVDPVVEQESAEKKEIAELLATLRDSGGGDWNAAVTRVTPRSWVIKGKSRNVAGHLITFDGETFNENDIYERFGGGTFKVVFKRKNDKGKLQYAGATTFTLAGDPKLPPEKLDLDEDRPVILAPSKEDDSNLVSKSMDLQERMLRRAEERAEDERKRAEEKANTNGKTDFAMIELMMAPMREQIRQAHADNVELRRQLLAAQERVASILTQKPDTTYQDKILEKMVDNKGIEIDRIRSQHESEIRMLKQSAADDIKRMEDRHDRAVTEMRSDFKRQLDTLKDSYEHRIKTMELAHQQTDAIHGITIKRLEHDLTTERNNITNLRAEKIKSPIDQLKELATIKGHFDELIAAPEAEDKPTWERVIDRVTDNPLIQGFAQRLANPAPSMAQLAQMQAMQHPQAMAAAGAGAAATSSQGVSESELNAAISFLETAIGTDKNPVDVARSAMQFVNKAILDELVKLGPDAFAAAVADLKPESIISTPKGRAFIKKVVAFLSGEEENGATN